MWKEQQDNKIKEIVLLLKEKNKMWGKELKYLKTNANKTMTNKRQKRWKKRYIYDKFVIKKNTKKLKINLMKLKREWEKIS